MLKPISSMSALAALAIAGCGGQEQAQSNATLSAKDPAASAIEKKIEESGEAGTVSAAEASQIADDYLAILSKFSTAIEGVSDQASAETAAETIAQLNDDMTALVANFEELTSVQQSALYIEHAQDFLNEQTRLADALTRVASENPELIEALQTEFEKMPALEN